MTTTEAPTLQAAPRPADVVELETGQGILEVDMLDDFEARRALDHLARIGEDPWNSLYGAPDRDLAAVLAWIAPEVAHRVSRGLHVPGPGDGDVLAAALAATATPGRTPR